MHFAFIQFLCLATLSLAATLGISAELPKRDFTIDVRQVDNSSTAGTVVSTQSRTPGLVAQRVTVRNGEKATVRFSMSMPLQWTQKLESSAQSSTNGATTTQTSGGAVTQGMVWMEAGQSLVLTPRWSGGKQPVLVELDIQTSAVDDRTGADLPPQVRSQTSTTVSAVLGEWTTIAVQGQSNTAGVYGSASSSDGPRALQIRVGTSAAP